MPAKRPGPLRVAEMAPSKGERLFKYIHKGHKPGGPIPFRARSVRVVRMFQSLRENGWTFQFKLEAMSPRGWPYRGEGATAEEAFLKAFRAWESDLQTFVPKVPQVAKAAAEAARAKSESEAIERKNKKTRIKELLLAVGPEIAALRGPGPRVPPSPDPVVNEKRVYNRLYMRAYRATLPVKRVTRPQAVAA